MAGLLEDIMGKMDTLIDGLAEHTAVMKQFLAANPGAGAAGTADDKPKTTRKPKTDTAAAGPVHTKEQVEALVNEKKTDPDNLAKIKPWLAEKTPDGKLASLYVLPSLYDEFFEFLTGLGVAATDEDDL